MGFSVFPWGDDPRHRGVVRRWIVAELENSLRRLSTDSIDLYQMHRPRAERIVRPWAGVARRSAVSFLDASWRSYESASCWPTPWRTPRHFSTTSEYADTSRTPASLLWWFSRPTKDCCSSTATTASPPRGPEARLR